MVIKTFISLLFIISISIYFIPISSQKHSTQNKEVPMVTFNDSIMYTLNEETMTRIVTSKKASRYRKYDIIYKGNFILKANNEQNKDVTDFISSNIITKKENDYHFLGKVKFRRDNYISFDTSKLYYNAKTQIATNKVPFVGTYYKDSIKAENLFLDLKKKIVKSKKTHFEIKTQ